MTFKSWLSWASRLWAPLIAFVLASHAVRFAGARGECPQWSAWCRSGFSAIKACFAARRPARAKIISGPLRGRLRSTCNTIQRKGKGD